MELYITEQIIKYSDGTETVIQFHPNDDAEAIESRNAEMVEANQPVEEPAPAVVSDDDVPVAPIEPTLDEQPIEPN